MFLLGDPFELEDISSCCFPSWLVNKFHVSFFLDALVWCFKLSTMVV